MHEKIEDYRQQIKPLDIIVQDNFPFIAEDFDALTMYEKYAKIVGYLNKVIEKSNLTAEQMELVTNLAYEIKNYVDNYFDNLDVQQEINNKLDALVQDGTLKEIIENQIFTELTTKVNNLETGLEELEVEITNKLNNLDMLDSFELDARRLGRILNENHKFDNTQEINFNAFQMQGGCYTGYNTACYALLDQERFQDTQTLIIKLNLETMQIIDSKNVGNCGHSNSIAYNPTTQELYVTKNDTNDIIVLDYNTLNQKTQFNISSIIDDGSTVNSFSYDSVNNKYYANTLNNLYEIDYNTKTLVKKYTIPWDSKMFQKLFSDYTIQNACVYDGYLFVLSHEPNAIISFKIEENNLTQNKIWNLKKQLNEFYLAREYQNISFMFDKNDFDVIFMTTGTLMNESEYNIQQFFKTNLKYNYATNFPNFGGRARRTVTVDITSTATNPTGNDDNAFKIIEEALDIANNNLFNNLQITVKAGTYPHLTIDVPGVQVYINGAGNQNTFVNGIECLAGRIFLNNLGILNNYVTDDNYLVYINRCEVTALNLDFIYNDDGSKLLFYVTETGFLRYNKITKNGSGFTHSNHYDMRLSAGRAELLNQNSNSLLCGLNDNSTLYRQALIRNINIAYGSLGNTDTEYEALMQSTIKKMYVHFTCSSSDQGYVKEFEAPTGNDSYYISEMRTTSSTIVIYECTLNFADGEISITDNTRTSISRSDGSVSKEDITSSSATNGIQIKDIYYSN